MIYPKQLLVADREYLCKQLEPIVEAYKMLKGEESWLQNKKKKPAEWSEEDMSKVQRICKYLNESKKYYADITEVRECMDWLKSLKQRIGE